MDRIPAPIIIFAGGIIGVVIAKKAFFSYHQIRLFNQFWWHMKKLKLGYLLDFIQTETGILTLVCFIIGCVVMHKIRRNYA